MIDNVERLLGFAEACRKQMQEPNMSDGDKAMLEIDAERHEAAAEEIQQLRARCEELDSLNDIDLAARDDLIQKLRAEVAALQDQRRQMHADMEIRVEPFGHLVQTTTDQNPPHGWAVYMFSGKDVEGSIPFYLAEAVEYMRKECERAWREVDFIAKERTEHLEWRTKLANDLDECERMRDALGVQLNKYHAVYKSANELMARLGHDGTIDTNSPLVEMLMNALDEIDGSTKGWL